MIFPEDVPPDATKRSIKTPMIKQTTIFFACLLLALSGRPQQPPASKTEKPNPVAANLLDVLFATNEDCDLLINEEAKGLLSRNDFRYIKLAPGAYRYKAKSKTTGDELSETFTVSETGTNEVFMDLLYTVDAKTEERAKLKGTVALKTAKTQTAPRQDEKITLTSKEAQAETLNALLSNTVLMKGGSFVMGNNRAPARDETEHPVTLSPFYFSKYEITQHQWETIMGSNPSIANGCPTCPVENVSWEDAMAFIRKLNSMSDQKFRLPTEAEWEYAARFGGRAEVEKAGGQEAYIKKTAWYFSNAESKVHPVGRKDPNVAGIFDLTGNVSEWCLDWYSVGYYKENYNQRNPEGPSLGKERVIRGGNFKDYVGDRFRPSFRNKRIPTGKSNEVGFRVVIEAAK